MSEHLLVTIGKEVLGLNHPDVSTACNNLAVLYHAQGKYEKAESLFLRDLKISEEVLVDKYLDSMNPTQESATCSQKLMYLP